MGKVVAIDGPAGAGKGTVAKLLSKECNLTYIDTGAMYRAVCYLCMKNNIDLNNEEEVIKQTEDAKIEFINEHILINEEDVTKCIRDEEISKGSSLISRYVRVREILVDMQRKMGEDKDIVMEGRDITTVVFPNADYKFYLDASLAERAKRRYIEYISKKVDISYEEVYENIRKRDEQDKNKEVGALKQAEDAIYIDTTNMKIKDVVARMKGMIV